jgi:hypothetical protein
MSNTTKKFGESGAWRGWTELGGDINWEDYGGKWAFRDPANPDHFYIVEIYGAANCEHLEGLDPHQATVRLVDLGDVTPDMIADAIKSCGPDDLEDYDPEIAVWAIVESLHSYGHAAPMGEESHPYRADIARANARRQVEAIVRNPDRREGLLSQPVNAIGSTAREYARGDFASGLRRSAAAYRPADWLPYVFGYMQAKNGAERDTSDDLAPEYIQGYDYGLKVAAGEADPPSWIR